MFDPHRTRRNDRRYYTKKGQVIQAKNLNAPFTIERNKVEAYKEYILKNRLIERDTPSLPINITSFHLANPEVNIPINELAYTEPSNLINIASVNSPRMLIQIKDQADGYSLIISNVGDLTSVGVESRTHYAFLSLEGNVGDYELSILNGNNTVMVFKDPATTSDVNFYYLPKTHFKFQLPAPSE